jgi:hypothetical protein
MILMRSNTSYHVSIARNNAVLYTEFVTFDIDMMMYSVDIT